MLRKLITSLLKSAAGKAIIELVLNLFIDYLKSRGIYACTELKGKELAADFVDQELHKL